MVFGNIRDLKDFGYLEENVRKCFDYAREHDLLSYEKGSHPIDGDELFVNIVEYETTTPENRFWEAHRQYLDLHYYDSFDEVLQTYPNGRFFFATTKAKRFYTDISFQKDDFLVFGKETAGLPKAILEAYPEQIIRIPMGKDIRSLNLANSVAIILYEALRQQGWPNLV